MSHRHAIDKVKLNIAISLLHDDIAAACPIDGVSIGDPTDKSTWKLHFQESATDEQRKAALDILEGHAPLEV